MRLLNFFLITLIVVSCKMKSTEVEKIKCTVDSCKVKEKISVHDDIRKKTWSVYSCGRIFPANRPYLKGDTIEIEIIKMK